MLLSQLCEATGSVKGPVLPGAGSKWDAGGMFLQKANALLPAAECGASPPLLAALLHLCQTRCHHFCPGTKLLAAGAAPLHPWGSRVRIRGAPSTEPPGRRAAEASPGSLGRQERSPLCCCKPVCGWKFLRAFPAAGIPPMPTIPHLLSAVCPSSPRVPLSQPLRAVALVAEPWDPRQGGLSSTERLLWPSVSLLGNRTQKYKFSKEIIKKRVNRC